MIYKENQGVINKELILHYDEKLSEMITYFTDTNDQEKIKLMRTYLFESFNERFNKKFKFLDDIVNSSSLNSQEKSDKIAELTSIQSTSNTMKNVYTLSPKVESYANELAISIFYRAEAFSNKKVRQLFREIKSASVYKSAEEEHFFKNVAFVTICIICKLFTSATNDNATLSQQTLKSSMANLFIETYMILNYKLDEQHQKNKEKKKDDKEKVWDINKRNKLRYQTELLQFTDKDLFHLGCFLIDCVENTRVRIRDNDEALLERELFFEENKNKKQKVCYFLTDFGKKILSVLPSYGNVYPFLKPQIEFKYGQTFYDCRVFSFTMYKYSSDAHITDDCTTINKNVFDALNYMQKMPYKINCKQLQNIKENMLEFYLTFTGGNFDLLLAKSGAEYVTLTVQPADRNKVNIVRKAYENYRGKNVEFEKFLDIICIAQIYQNHALYFNHFTDFRGRIYCNGYPLTPQGDFLSRGLLSIEGNDELIGHDVSASGFQIVGLLIGSSRLLELTNFIPRDKYPITQYKDLYEYMRKHFIDYFLAQKLKNNSSFGEITADNAHIFFDRALIKSMAMCYIYGEGNLSRGNKIAEDYSLMFKKDLRKWTRYQAALIFEKYIEEFFPEIIDLKNLLVNLTKNICKIKKEDETLNIMRLSASKEHITALLIYGKQKVQRISFIEPHSGHVKKINLSLPVIPFKIDVVRTVRSVVANYIHMIDSLIAMKLILVCKEKDIPLFTIHDSFYVNSKHTEIIKDIYYNTAISIMSDMTNSPLLSLLSVNKDLLSEEDYNALLRQCEDYYNASYDILYSTKMNTNILKIEKANKYTITDVR